MSSDTVVGTVAGDVAVDIAGTGRWPRPGRRTASARSAAGDATAVRRFAVKPLLGGDPIRCELHGDPDAGALRHGDLVRATVRRHRDGTCAVRRVEVLETPTGPVARTIRGRSPLRRWSARLSLGAAGVLALLVAATLARLFG